METCHGLGVGGSGGRRGGLPGTVLHGASWLVLSSLLVACGGSPAGGEGEVKLDAAVLPETEGQGAAQSQATAQGQGQGTGPDQATAEGQATDGPEVMDPDTVVAGAAAKLPIIVNLAVGEGSGASGDSGEGTIAAVTARVMERLKAAMPAGDLAAVQTFGSLPAMALSADGALIARLLAMPEVVSIELDRELQPLGLPCHEI